MSEGNGASAQTATTNQPVEYKPTARQISIKELAQPNKFYVGEDHETADKNFMDVFVLYNELMKSNLKELTQAIGHIRDAVEIMANRYHGQWLPERMRAIAIPASEWKALDDIEKERVKVDAKNQGREIKIIPDNSAMSPDDFDGQISRL